MESIKDVEYACEIEKLEQEIKGHTFALIGLSDSTGFSTTGYNYLTRILRSLKLRVPEEPIIFNAHFKNLTNEAHIEEMIAGNISLRDVKKIQYYEIEDFMRKTLESYHFPNDQKLITIGKSIFHIKDPIIKDGDGSIKLSNTIRDCEDVRIFYSTNMGKINEHTPMWFIEEEREQRKRNFDYILSINPNAKIYAIGLMTPNKLSEKGFEAIMEQNHFYKKLAIATGTAYINTADFIKAFKGNNQLANHEIDNLAFRCIRAMCTTELEPQERISPLVHSNQDGLDYLYKRSIERTNESENLKKGNDEKTKKFLTEQIQKEKQLQKIYKKVKEGYFE